jgi:hypothetical protein
MVEPFSLQEMEAQEGGSSRSHDTTYRRVWLLAMVNILSTRLTP